MASKPADWHNQRARNMLRAHPEIKKLFGFNRAYFLYLAFVPILHVSALFFSSTVSWPVVIILACTVGAYCRMGVFNIMHELCHRTIHPKISEGFRTFLLMIVQLPSVAASFSYFRWFHLSHHTELGTQSVEEAAKLAASQGKADGDIIFAPGFHAVKYLKSDPQPKLARWMHNPVHRYAMLGFILPVMRTIVPLLRGLRLFPKNVKKVFSLLGQKDKEGAARVSLILLEQILIFGLIFSIGFFLGPKSLSYLFLGQFFYRGFCFHPYLSYWLIVHKSHSEGKESCQPTTSIYGPFMNVICGGVNLHVEHHDLPSIPVSRLKQLRPIAPEFYGTISRYDSWGSFMKDLFQNGNKVWAYGCQGHSDNTDSVDKAS